MTSEEMDLSLPVKKVYFRCLKKRLGYWLDTSNFHAKGIRNDLDYKAISNIHLVLYFDTYYSQDVANLVIMAELEAGAIYQQTLGIALRFQFPDEFFSFQDTGEVTFSSETTTCL